MRRVLGQNRNLERGLALYGCASSASNVVRRFIPLIAGIVVFAISGCSGGGDLSTAALQGLPELPKISLPKPPPPVVGTPTEVYERVGRGAMSCWFGANGSLKSTHIYDAVAEPAHKGGRAEINIRERNNGPEGIRGGKAFRIQIAPEGEDKATVMAENLKLPAPVGEQMKKSVMAWATGNHSCDTEAFAGAWEPAAAAPDTKKAAQPKQKAARK